jgi:molybdopterin-guanine dinucleotide biosynthesis protein A
MQYNIAAAILCGGRAIRYNGKIKSLLTIYNNETILSRTINQIKKVKKANIKNIVISSNNNDVFCEYNFPVVSDLNKGIGPIGGIESILTYFKNQIEKVDAVVFLAGDMPAITSQVIENLIVEYEKNPDKIHYAISIDGAHPLCAVCPVLILDALQIFISQNEKKIIKIWESLKAVPVYFESSHLFLNINTEKDWFLLLNTT